MTRWLLAALVLAVPLRASAGPERSAPGVVIVDDGETIARDASHPLAPSPWPAPGPVELFALRGETVAFQVVVQADTVPVLAVGASLGPLRSDAGALASRVEVLAERFVRIVRSTGNDRERDSIAFTGVAAPRPGAFVGEFADALTTGDAGALVGQRAALWVDLEVPADARPGTYDGELSVHDAQGEIARRDVSLRVLGQALPFAATRATVFYDSATLRKRMGRFAVGAERELRKVLHAHHVSAIRELNLGAPWQPGLDDSTLTGEAFTPAAGYHGPGAGIGEGVFAIGAYGTLGEPRAESKAFVDDVVGRIRGLGVFDTTETFVYAVDEDCGSPRPAAWRVLLRGSGVRVGVTCGDDPLEQSADLVMMPPDVYVRARARLARLAGKDVWVYNGRRPYAGPMVLDVPAVDLRANAWIAVRYDVPRWFYWESTYWLDDGKGGRGGPLGFDPFEVAETFHDLDGDHANGDGVLVYPGAQENGMRSYGAATVFASVRLKNIRRGIEDAGYVALAREIDPTTANAIVQRMIPRALALAGSTVSWPERGAAWLDARRELATILERGRRVAPDHIVAPVGCDLARTTAPGDGVPGLAGAALGFGILLGIRRAGSSRLRYVCRLARSARRATRCRRRRRASR